MTSKPATRFAILFIALTIITTACAPGVGTGSRDTTTGKAAPPAGPKVMTLGVARLLNTLQRRIVGAVAGAGEPQIWNIAHEHLYAERGDELVSRLAELPSVEKGTWRVNADGSMDTIWRIQPNIKWHDGAPFTADDMVFTYEVYKDPELPNQSQPTMALMRGVEAPDPLTFVVHYSTVYVDGDRPGGLYPLPRHLIEEQYRADKQTLLNSSRWTSDFVGLGPYRVERWEEGSQIDFVRFDGYWQGRPPLDRVVVRLIPDANTMVANILAGDIDAIIPNALTLDAAAELKQRWEGTGNQVYVFLEDQLRVLDIQHRPDVARPGNGLASRTVRQGLYQATDRTTLANVITNGFGVPADSWFRPNDEIRRELESSIPQFPYDPARARQVLAEGGWAPGPDGVLTHRDTGERFAIEVRGDPTFEREAAVIADNWKAAGAEPSIYVIPAALAGDRSQKANATGVFFTNVRGPVFYVDRLHSKRTVTAENRYTGTNNGAYFNPAVDGILDKLVATIDPRRRLELHKDLLREHLADIPAMMLYWNPEPVPALKGVVGVRGPQTWNFYEWDKV